MVAAVHYFATEADQFTFLDYLGEPETVTLHPWPVVTAPAISLDRHKALHAGRVMIVSRALGRPVLVRPGSAAMEARGRSGLFNRLNWERLRPAPDEGLVDSNASPVLLWEPGPAKANKIVQSSIGSQADSMAAISADYSQWVNRAMNWVRRRGTKVWGLERSAIRPDLDIRLSTVSTVFALPEALAAMEAGSYGDEI